MKLCIRRLFFLIPHLILSTFHAGIGKIFLRLVLVNSPHLLFCSPQFLSPPSPRFLSATYLFRKWSLGGMAIRFPLRRALRAEPHALKLAQIWRWVSKRPWVHGVRMYGFVPNSGKSCTFGAPLTHALSAALPSHTAITALHWNKNC